MSSNVEYHRLHDNENKIPPSKKFLFFFSPDYIAKECCCGCTLQTGAQIISILQIISSFSNLISAFWSDSDFTLLFYGFVFLLYFSAGVLIFLTSSNRNYEHAYVSYLIYATLFLINLFDCVLVTFMIFFGFYNPIHGLDFFRAGFLYLISSLLAISIQLYFVWIIYSFAINATEMKHKIRNTVPETEMQRLI